MKIRKFLPLCALLISLAIMSTSSTQTAEIRSDKILDLLPQFPKSLLCIINQYLKQLIAHCEDPIPLGFNTSIIDCYFEGDPRYIRNKLIVTTPDTSNSYYFDGKKFKKWPHPFKCNPDQAIEKRCDKDTKPWGSTQGIFPIDGLCTTSPDGDFQAWIYNLRGLTIAWIQHQWGDAERYDLLQDFIDAQKTTINLIKGPAAANLDDH